MGILGGIFNNKEEQLQARIEELVTKLNSLNKELKEKNDKITSLQNDIKALHREIENQNDKSSSQKKQIEILKNEIAIYQGKASNLESEMTQLKSRNISDRQMEIVEKNLRENQKTISEYKRQISVYEETIKNLTNTINANGISLSDKKIYNYKISIDDFFNNSKSKEIVETLKNNNINYIDDIDTSTFESLLLETKNYSECKKKFIDFLDGKMDWDTKTFKLKGERIKKIFSKSRKFLTYANDNYLQFMDDISDFDMRVLYDEGFTKNTIIELIEKKETYFNENTI
ncbi:hypothetical protein [Fusobacterium sp. PH5-44]|uniref:coiled-coil domain-containing protein n=1 Tax=unclassified Fusobacterium TaxID=2648384 RepID=UPI003D21CD23